MLLHKELEFADYHTNYARLTSQQGTKNFQSLSLMPLTKWNCSFSSSQKTQTKVKYQ